LGQLLGITQRTVTTQFDHSKDKYSRRKLIPVNAKTMGDHLLLKRIATNLSQPELALKTGVSERLVSAWKHDRLLQPKPNGSGWRTFCN
jgi:DNA-binding transcriptional regulator YiaG